MTAAVGRLASKADALSRRLRAAGPINFAHRGGAKVVPEDTIEDSAKDLPWAQESWNATFMPPPRAPSSSFMTLSLTGRLTALDPWLRRRPELQGLDAGYRFSTDAV